MSTKTFRVRKTLIAALGATLLAAVMAGCGGGGDSVDTSVPPAGTDATASITWWGWTPGPPATDNYIAAFNEAYPGVSVEWKQLDIDGYNAAITPALGTAEVDAYEMSSGSGNGGVEVYGENAIDLTADVEALLGSDWQSQLSPLGVKYMSVDDRLVALSAGAVYAGNLWINQDLFDQYNLKAPKTYDEWKKVCATFKANGVGCFVQGANQGAFNIDTFHAIANQIDPAMFLSALNNQSKWTDADMVQAAENWKALFDDGIMQSGAAGLMQYPEANNMFLSGDYAMVMMGTWYTMYTRPADMTAAMESAGVSNPTPFTIVPIDFPDMAGKGNTGIMFGDADYGLGVSAKSGNVAAAKAFTLWLGTSQEGQQVIADSLNLIPARLGVTPDWDTIELVNADVQSSAIKAIYEDAGKADQSRFGDISADMNDALILALSAIATGMSSPADAMAELQATADSLG